MRVNAEREAVHLVGTLGISDGCSRERIGRSELFDRDGSYGGRNTAQLGLPSGTRTARANSIASCRSQRRQPELHPRRPVARLAVPSQSVYALSTLRLTLPPRGSA